MVFESIVVDVLNRILGDYIENLDSKQLSIGIWGGDVVLQDLLLKQSALDDLNLPVQTVYGRLGKLVLKIPWKNLYGAPVEAAIDRLYLLLVPNLEVKYDAEKEEKNFQNAKQSDLKRIEEAKKKAAKQGQPKADDSFVEKLTTQIIKNVQVKITNIHIRYEDKVTNPGNPFACGISLSNLSVETSNEDWQVGIINDAISKIYKVLDLDSLAVYWNCNCPMYSTLTVNDIILNFSEGIATKSRKPDNYNYLLGPINSSARLRMNPKPENDDEPFSISKILLNFEMEKLAIGITKGQYQNLMLLADSMSRMSSGMPYRKYRPFVKTYKGHYREWWKFAYTCILEENVRRRRRNWDWLHISNHRELCKEYACAYQVKLQNTKVPADVQGTIKRCENQLDVMNLVLIRQRIELEVARLAKNAEKKPRGTWYSGWWGKAATPDDQDDRSSTDILRQFEAAMTTDEKSKLYQAIDYQENSAPAEYPESFVATNCAFVLRCLEIEILDDSLPVPRVLSTELKNVKCRLLQRPATNALTVAVKIDQFTVFGFQQQSIFPQLVSSENLSEGGVLLDVLFETNPLDKKCDQRLHVKFLPIKIVYDAQTIIKVSEIFKRPESLALEQLEAVAGNKLADFKQSSATGLQFAIEKHLAMDLDIDISAPYVMLPYGGFFTSDLKSLLIVNLGHVKIKSVVRDVDAINVRKLYQEGTEEEMILKQVMAQSYDKYVLELSEVQMLIANTNEDWRTCIIENIISPMHIVQPVTLTVNLENCIVCDDPRLPKAKVAGQLPSIMINMSDDRLLTLVDLLQSIPLPGSKDIEPVPLQNIVARSSVLSIFVNENTKKNVTHKRKDIPENFVQTVDLEVKFEMRELVLTISKKSQTETEAAFDKLLQFRCIALELDMTQQTYNMDVTVRLGGIGLTHFRSLGPIQIISTPMTTGSDEYLFTVQYGTVDKMSPEFYSKYGSCEQRLQLNFTTLEALLHQEGIQELMKVATDIQSQLEKINKPLNKDRTASAGPSQMSKRMSIIHEISQKKVKLPVPRRRQKRFVVETIQFRLVANLEQFNIILANDKRRLAIFGIKGAATDLIIKKSYTQISATLKDLNIYDCNPYSLHSAILRKTSNTEDTINAQVVIYNNTEVDANKDDIKFLLSVTGLKITFLNLFVTNILDFLNQFQMAQQAIIDASAAAAETAKLNIQNIQVTATRIVLNIKLKAPVIIIPTNSTSHDVIIIDLGNVDLTNNFIQLEALNEHGQAAVVDDLRLNLLDMKVSRALLDDHMQEKKCECVLLQPLSFLLRIKRNLSVSWYNNIPDLDIAGEMKSIELTISETDYAKMIQVLSENLAEGAKAVPPPVEPSVSRASRAPSYISKDTIPKRREARLESVTKKPHTNLRFSLTMDNLIINLFNRDAHEDADQVVAHEERNSLARFTLLIFSVKGSILTDGSISTSLLLVDCLLDDTRPEQQSKLTRLMERRSDLDDKTTKHEHLTKSMIDVTFQQKGDNMFADVRVLSFNWILSMDYLMKIGAFFSPPEISSKDVDLVLAKGQQLKKARTHRTSSEQTVTQAKDVKNMTINLKIEQPSIFLVERMDDINTNTLVLNTEILLNARINGPQQTIRGSINDLELYTCCYNPARRADTKYSVLRPCNLSVVGTTPKDKGLHLDVTISEIRLSVSPAVIELLSRCQATMTGAAETLLNESTAITYYEDIWDQKEFGDSDYWFLKTEEGQDAMDQSYLINEQEDAKCHLKELCVITANSIIFTLEAGVGNKTLPMLMLETGIEGKVRDWTSKLTIDSSISLQMAYYNSRLAVWEPLVEPCSVMENGILAYSPWTLNLKFKKNDRDENPPLSPSSEIEAFEELPFAPPLVSIDVFSNTNLEIVVTKTFLEVISDLGKGFQNAMKFGIPIQEAKTAPYKVVNDSGLKIALNLNDSLFEVYDQEYSAEEYREVVLESGAAVQLHLIPDLDYSRALAKPNTSGILQMEEKFLKIFIDSMKCSLTLPVLRADKRYFPLNYKKDNNDSWGIISDITVDGGVTTITLRSILQVHNYFQQPVNVYFMTDRGNELESIKQIPPNTTLNLPMNSVYTLTNELFFSVEGHCVTAVPYIWKDLQHNLSLEKTLICPAGNKIQQPFVMKVCGDIEQVYFENTTKHTMVSSCYNIHLMPAIAFKNCLPIPVSCVTQGNMEEFSVKPGEQLHLPTVNPGYSYVVLRLENYLDREWVCRRDLGLNAPEFSVWAFDSHEGVRKMTLDLGMHCQTKKGTMVMSLYCPFWMLNKTGLMLTYRNSDDNANILYHPENFKGPVLFSFAAKNFFGKKKAAIRVKNGEWSDKFSLDVAGSSGMIVCRSEGVIHQIGVHNQLTYNGLTKQVTFTPFFVLINNTNYSIECQELERPADPWVVVPSNSCHSLWPRSERDDKLLKLKISGTIDVSAPFLFSEAHNTLLKLQNKYGGVNVDIQVTEGGIYLNFSAYGPGLAPALIINHSSQELRIWEKESVNVKRLTKKHQLLHAWENPTGPRLLIWETGKKKEICDDLRKDGLGEFSLIEGKRIFWVSFLDGMQRVLLFTEDVCIAKDAESAGDLESIDNEINISIHGVGISLVNNLIRQELLYIGIASSGIIWETCKSNSKRYKQLSLKDCILIESAYKDYLLNPDSNNTQLVDPKTEVDFRNEIMLRPHKRKLRRAFQTGVWLQMKTSPNQMQLHAKINRLQIDNQMHDCIFPIILAPVPPPKSVAADSAIKPFAELSIVQRVMKHSTVQQYKYFKVLIQEFHIKVDLGFVNSLMSMIQAKEPSQADEIELFTKDMSLVNEPLMSHVSSQSLQEQKNFYDLLHFSPLKIHVSFSLAAPTSGAGQPLAGSTPTFLNVLLQGLGVTLTDMNDVVFRLAYFEREYSFLTQRQLSSECTTHYVGQFVKQLYVLVLGLDVLGNPYGLVLGISKGVEDLFYEPFQGAIQGPGEFAEGLVLGVRSLFGHTVGGAAGAVSRITGAMGKGIAALTFDKDYQRKRRDQINKKPANIQEGIARGGKGLVMGVVDGVTGVFTKPVQGAKEQGVEGFFKGLGKGAVGLVTRPTAGVIDFASGSLDAVKRATELSDDVNRLRPARFMRADGLVRPYIKVEAEGNKLLTELEKGKYANTDIYSYHVWIVDKKDILLLTDKRLAYVVHNDIFGGWQMEWSYTWKNVHELKVVDKGVQVTTEQPKKKVLGLFGSGETGKIIILPDLVQRKIIKDKMEELRQNALAL